MDTNWPLPNDCAAKAVKAKMKVWLAFKPKKGGGWLTSKYESKRANNL